MPQPSGPQQQIEVEIERLARRWESLPLDRALDHVPAVLAAAQRLADLAAEGAGQPTDRVPDLGPRVLIDQLRVLVADARTAEVSADRVAEELTALRRRVG